jgi:hypothetical protein
MCCIITRLPWASLGLDHVHRNPVDRARGAFTPLAGFVPLSLARLLGGFLGFLAEGEHEVRYAAAGLALVPLHP